MRAECPFSGENPGIYLTAQLRRIWSSGVFSVWCVCHSLWYTYQKDMYQRLLELGKAVLAERDLDRMLTVAIDGLIDVCGAERGVVLLVNAEGKMAFEVARRRQQEDLEKPEWGK